MSRDYAGRLGQGGILQPIQQHTWDVTWRLDDPRFKRLHDRVRCRLQAAGRLQRAAEVCHPPMGDAFPRSGSRAARVRARSAWIFAQGRTSYCGRSPYESKPIAASPCTTRRERVIALCSSRSLARSLQSGFRVFELDRGQGIANCAEPSGVRLRPDAILVGWTRGAIESGFSPVAAQPQAACRPSARRFGSR